MEFKAKSIFIDEEKQVSLIEFEITGLGEKSLKGVDVCHWQGDKLSEIRAYLY